MTDNREPRGGSETTTLSMSKADAEMLGVLSSERYNAEVEAVCNGCASTAALPRPA